MRSSVQFATRQELKPALQRVWLYSMEKTPGLPHLSAMIAGHMIGESCKGSSLFSCTGGIESGTFTELNHSTAE